MRRLAILLRPRQTLIDICIRGPKKKGQVQAKIQSNDIINIYKDKPDPEPRDIKQYPIFVQEMSLGMNSIHELLYATENNIKFMMPTRPVYKSYLRGIKRQRFKEIRDHKQLDTMDIQNDEKYQIHERTSLYDFFRKTKQQKQQQQRLAAQQAAKMEQEQQDQ